MPLVSIAGLLWLLKRFLVIMSSILWASYALRLSFSPEQALQNTRRVFLLANRWALWSAERHFCLLWGIWHSSLRFVSMVISRCTAEKYTLDALWLGTRHFLSAPWSPSSHVTWRSVCWAFDSPPRRKSLFSRLKHWSWIGSHTCQWCDSVAICY